MTNHLDRKENDADKASRNGKRPLNERAPAAQHRAQHEHAALPSILLIEWKQIRGGQQKIYSAKARPGSQRSGDQIDVDSCQHHQYLLAKRSAL